FDKTVSQNDADWMIRPVTNEEIKQAKFDIDYNKAPVQMVSLPSSIKSLGRLLGMRHGYFKGGRGLRQGDPISSYVFTMVMEVFNLTMKQYIEEIHDFRYHWGCKQLKITHLCFADDLLVLCHGDLKSTMIVKKALDHFCSISGLNLNMGKTTVFFRNLKYQVKRDILSILPFKVGSFPVTYLGVPFISKQIGINDCKRLLNKVKDKVLNWKNKMLTYAGGL
nr:RNA-directed DNA polymerase, eukaryota, reverse transcriptase zinc-binding domain protein [Tanacetum cinerariifolium]